MLIWFGVLGLIVGSFLGSITWRLSVGLSVASGRSVCPNCKKGIFWYDNVPVFSYLLLGGKCRSCHTRISIRYPVIEGLTSIVFVLVASNFEQITTHLPWLYSLGAFGLVVLLSIFSILIAILVTDIEHQLIFDELVFAGLALVLISFLVGDFDKFFVYILAGFLMSIFLLLINIITHGRGMGFGDVKLALFIGTMLGLKDSLVSLFVSFLTGAILGIILIVLGKANIKDKIAFGPFMIIGFVVVLFLSKYYAIPF